MRFTYSITCLLASVATALVPAPISQRDSDITFPKVNEYKDANCQVGSYTHHSGVLGCVNMDATTNSVYLTNGDRMYGAWVGYGCRDCGCSAFRGSLPGQCVNINAVRPGRVNSVMQVPLT
ncbi:hypothetical protein DL98DRAFT_538478 [Cadophora sp. DSE1049]|nr:hypothetical protein DL98DRAFT_538478 [Cadophora sp. DSE1049]